METASLPLHSSAALDLSVALRDARRRGGALAESEVLRALEAEPSDPALALLVGLHLQRVLPELGEYADAHRFADMEEEPGVPSSPSPVLPSGLVVADPVQAIAEAASSRTVVMLSESHHVPQHRAFAAELLPELARTGFTHFAAETLYAPADALERRGYPVEGDGAYAAEPWCAELFRTARRSEMQVVAYEAPPGTGPAERSAIQAANLAALATKRNVRVAVLAGPGHVDLGRHGARAATTAALLRTQTGMEALCVDQTAMTEHSSPAYEHPLYEALLRRAGAPRRAFVMRHGGSRPWAADAPRRHVTVVHPRSRYVRGRPHWLRMGGLRRPIPLPTSLRAASVPSLVRARSAGAAPEAVPVDQLVLQGWERAPLLYLPPGDYEVDAVDARGIRTPGMHLRVDRRVQAMDRCPPSPPRPEREIL